MLRSLPTRAYLALVGVRDREDGQAMEYVIRRARTRDVRAIRGLIDANVASGRLLGKATVTLYEDVQEFWVACGPAPGGADGEVIGCGALHVMWEDLAEIRTIAVAESHQGHGAGHKIVMALLVVARELGVRRVFVLTFAVEFFRRHGFEKITGQAASPEAWTKPRAMANNRESTP